MEWILRVLIAIDQLGNTIAGGNPKALISARVGYFSNKKQTSFQNYWKLLEWVIDFSFYPIDGPNHCLRTLDNDSEKKYIQGSDLAKALLGLIIIITSIFITLFLRLAILIIPSWHYKFKKNKLDIEKLKKDKNTQDT